MHRYEAVTWCKAVQRPISAQAACRVRQATPHLQVVLRCKDAGSVARRGQGQRTRFQDALGNSAAAAATFERALSLPQDEAASDVTYDRTAIEARLAELEG